MHSMRVVLDYIKCDWAPNFWFEVHIDLRNFYDGCSVHNLGFEVNSFFKLFAKVLLTHRLPYNSKVHELLTEFTFTAAVSRCFGTVLAVTQPEYESSAFDH